MQFHEVRFPASLSFGSTGGPERRTDVVTLAKADQPSGVATGLLLLGRSAQQTNIVPIA